MNIETANRLYQYRKKMGISQEELASRIGVSRQAVSKWERAEASPDTDNLIELSKVYGVTLDEMLQGPNDSAQPEAPASDTDASDTADSASEQAEYNAHSDTPKGNKVNIGFGGIHVHDKNGTKVDIDRHGIFVNEHGEQKVYTDENGTVHRSEDIKAAEEQRKNKNIWLKLPFPLLAVAAYILFGTLNVMGGWAWGWIVFLTIPLYYTLVEAIIRRDLRIFAYPVLAAIIFLILGASMGVWHPAWIIFLTIPVYYWIANAVSKQK